MWAYAIRPYASELRRQFAQSGQLEEQIHTNLQRLNMQRSMWPTLHVSGLIQAGRLMIGDGYRAKNEELGPTGLPFARAGNINRGFHFADADHVSPEVVLRAREKVSRPGDVLFTSKGTVGRFAFVRQDTPQFVYSPQLCYWRILDPNAIEPRFLYYWMHGREFTLQVNGVKGQTDMAEYVSLIDQRRMHITLPPLPEQRAIAAILGALDDKIELNRRMNETLEAMARALFQSWFVDFDPVRAKMEGRQPAGMDADTAALFPDGFEDSPLGETPRGWAAVPLPMAIEINPPRSLPKGTIAPYLEMSNMPTHSARATRWENRAFISGMRFTNGDTLVARITPCLENGKTAFVDFLPSDRIGWGSTEYIVLRPKSPLPPEYAYFLARSDDFRSHAIKNITGTSGRQRVPVECFDSYLTIVPAREVADRFGEVATLTVATMKAHDEEARTLATIRDALLPKMLSGEIRVAEAETMVEAVV